MAALPVVGGDLDTWGTILNDFLLVSINADGTLSTSAVEMAVGVLGGDLSGTLPDPSVNKIKGITLSGTPSTGQVLTATSPTAADWQTPSGGGGNLTGDVTSASNVATLQPTANVESITRLPSPNQLQPMTAALNFNTQAATWMSFLDMQDGTAGDGRVHLSLNPPVVEILGNAGDAVPVISFGTILGAPAMGLGPGGSTAQDITFIRTGAAALTLETTTFTVFDKTAAHGSIVDTFNPPSIHVYANSTDTQPMVTLGSFFAEATLALGPGGSSAVDVFVNRVSGALELQGNFVGMGDGTGAHGKVQTTFNPPSVAGYGNSTDTQPVWAVSEFSGSPALFLGPGGTTAVDVILLRQSSTQVALNVGLNLSAAVSNPLQLTVTPNGPTGLTSNTSGCVSLYFGGTNYYWLLTFDDGGTVRYKYLEANGTGTTWAQGTTLPV